MVSIKSNFIVALRSVSNFKVHIVTYWINILYIVLSSNPRVITCTELPKL